MMKIIQLTSEHIEYVVDIVIKRWEVSRKYALEQVHRWLSNVDNTVCFVGIINERPMATGVFETSSDIDYSIPCWNTLLWVEPEHRGMEYGKVISKIRFEYAKKLGHKTVYLDTVNAKEYHLKRGWEIVREFDKDGEHYTIMKYELI